MQATFEMFPRVSNVLFLLLCVISCVLGYRRYLVTLFSIGITTLFPVFASNAYHKMTPQRTILYKLANSEKFSMILMHFYK